MEQRKGHVSLRRILFAQYGRSDSEVIGYSNGRVSVWRAAGEQIEALQARAFEQTEAVTLAALYRENAAHTESPAERSF